MMRWNGVKLVKMHVTIKKNLNNPSDPLHYISFLTHPFLAVSESERKKKKRKIKP